MEGDVAIFHFEIKLVGRAPGREIKYATSAAAYQAGERIRDVRTGKIFDQSQRRDILYKEIILPARFEDSQIDWARDRSELWNAAELAEVRDDARVARAYEISLPAELDAENRIALIRSFSQHVADRYRNAVDIAIHAPRPGSDPRNVHAHLLSTVREIEADGLGLKTSLEIDSDARVRRGLNPAVNEYLWLRERWATSANLALSKTGMEARIDHRSLEAQGIDREPSPRIPVAAREIERRGEHSIVAERIRAEHQMRAQARLDKSAALAAADDRAARAKQTADQGRYLERSSIRPQSLQEIRRQARENWLRMREQGSEKTAAASDLARDDDLAI